MSSTLETKDLTKQFRDSQARREEMRAILKGLSGKKEPAPSDAEPAVPAETPAGNGSLR